MLYPIHVLEDSEARVSGMGLARALSRLLPARVTIQLGAASLRRALWSLPVIEAIASTFVQAELRIRARPEVARLLAAYERPAPVASRLSSELDVHLEQVEDEPTANFEASSVRAALESTGASHRLTVPAAPFPAHQQHAAAHAVDGAQVAGLPARMYEPRLRIGSQERREARALCRALAGGNFGGPLAVLAPAAGGWSPASFARVLERLREQIGAVGIVVGSLDVPGVRRVVTTDPALVAAMLELAAICIGDDGDWAHVAAAAGAPTLIVHGHTSPVYSGPLCRHSVSAFTTNGDCERCRADQGRRCLACLDPSKVGELAEELSSRRWPFDRLERMMP
ncbi:MAG TPA: glycosyltransferase family 9 protein [Polyangiaceae bacterium]